MPKIFSNADFENNQLVNAKLEKVSSDPASPEEARIWYNNSSEHAKLEISYGAKTIAHTDDIVSIGTSAPTNPFVQLWIDTTPIANKTSLTDNDEFSINDSEDNDNPKITLWSTIKSVLNSFFDTIYQSKHTTQTATLTVAGWSSSSQTVNVTGVTASNTVILSPAAVSQAAYSAAGIVCTAQGAGTLTFTCTTTPTAELTVNAVILGV